MDPICDRSDYTHGFMDIVNYFFVSPFWAFLGKGREF